MRMKFAADRTGSNEFAYHYELINKEWEPNLKLYLEIGFEKHDRERMIFLHYHRRFVFNLQTFIKLSLKSSALSFILFDNLNETGLISPCK